MGGLSGSAAAEIAAPLRTVFSAVADIAGYVAWHPGLDAATVLELDRWGRQSIVRIELTRGGRQLSSELRFSYESDRRVSWVQESGDAVDSMEAGRWSGLAAASCWPPTPSSST